MTTLRSCDFFEDAREPALKTKDLGTLKKACKSKKVAGSGCGPPHTQYQSTRVTSALTNQPFPLIGLTVRMTFEAVAINGMRRCPCCIVTWPAIDASAGCWQVYSQFWAPPGPIATLARYVFPTATAKQISTEPCNEESIPITAFPGAVEYLPNTLK